MVGKPIGSGMPAAVYGCGQALANRIHEDWDYHAADECGIGGTLAGNMLSVAAVRATLREVLTEEAYGRMIPLAGRWADGVQGVIDEFALPWVVKRLGCRAEYWLRPSRRATAARRPRRRTSSSTATCTSSCSTAASS